MKKKSILIKCADTLDKADWVILSPQGELLERAENKDIAELSKHSEYQDAQVKLFIASPEITIRQINLPPKLNKQNLDKFIPNVLEEELISNIEKLHFAFTKQHDDQLNVAIVSNETIKEWENKLKQVNVLPLAIYPLCLALTPQDNEWRIWFENELACVQLSPQMGFTIEKQLLPSTLHYFFQKAANKPTQIITNLEHSSAESDFAAYPDLASLLQPMKDSIWNEIKKSQHNINLLSPTSSGSLSPKFIPYLFHAGIILVLASITYIATELYNINKLNRSNEELTQNINTLYKEFFPHATSVTSPKQRIEQELKNLAGGSNSSFYDLLYSFGQIVSNKPSITIKNLSYKPHLLTITLEANNYDEIEKLISQLKINRINVNQNKTEQHKDKVTAILAITRKSN